ncbi:MAG: hypothetical protein HEEMFOPI_01444 [Holosporales bacterium]
MRLNFSPLNAYSTWHYNKPDHKFLDQVLEGFHKPNSLNDRRANIKSNVEQVFESIHSNHCDYFSHSIFLLKITSVNTGLSSTFFISGMNLDKVKIYKHENVIDESIEAYEGLMHEYHLQLSPIILLTESKNALNTILQEFNDLEPFKIYIEGGFKFEIFKKDIDSKNQRWQDFLNQNDAYFLIDGHHRFDFFERNKNQYPHCMVAIGSLDAMQMNVRPRILHTEKMRSEKDAFCILMQFFDQINMADLTPKDYVLRAYNKTFGLRLKAWSTHQKNFEISPFVAEEIILKKSLCENYSSAKITTLAGHFNDIENLLTKTVSLDAQAIVVPAVFDKEMFLKCAQNHLHLPAQSTWFYPKIPEGLLVYDFMEG